MAAEEVFVRHTFGAQPRLQLAYRHLIAVFAALWSYVARQLLRLRRRISLRVTTAAVAGGCRAIALRLGCPAVCAFGQVLSDHGCNQSVHGQLVRVDHRHRAPTGRA